MHYSLTRATLWNIAGYLYLILASLIATPILVHSLGLNTFAQYGLIVATLALISSFNLGLPQAVTRELAANHKTLIHRQTVWATSSLLFIATGLVGATISTIVSYYLRFPTLTFFLVFSLALINNLVSHYATLPQAEGHFGYFNAKTFIVGTANTLLAAYLASTGRGILVILSSQLLCYLITLLPLVFFSLKYFPHPRDGVASRSVAKSLISFGLKSQVGTIVGQVQSQYAKYLLITISPLSLTGYIIAQGLVQKLAGGISQVSSALYPAAARTNTFNLRPLYYRLQFGLFLLALLGIGVYTAIGYPFLVWWLDSPELVAIVHSVLNILIWYLGILVLTPLASSVLDGSGHPGITSLIAFITTAIEIILTLFLFSNFGLMAPVYAALIALAIMTPVLLYCTEKVLTQHQST